ncbi:hypothetical protein C21_04754 [Arenibacter sp. NBRC 103722]|uniref:hypothetical protein n=1 Tax=Arenibacter sp. NBRC 103722 TaxID=1113929 RepID=UPI00085351B9|nr:hypothetical protein [Arenibacter sp. NBRC 103722]GBF22559.1 hypothetical protein C21_04754 [Arenibacter sp. NBRC 103722]
MKKIITLTVFFLLVLSCSDSKDGDWEDNIKLSQKEVQFSSAQNNIEISTEGTGWWIGEVSMDGELFDLNGIDTTKENFTIEEIEFSIERKNSTEIFISMQQNPTESARVLIIGLQSGDYFDGVKITQSGN